MYLCTDDPVVQWIEFKIPVLTMKVRILSGPQSSDITIALLFYSITRLQAYTWQRYNIFFNG